MSYSPVQVTAGSLMVRSRLQEMVLPLLERSRHMAWWFCLVCSTNTLKPRNKKGKIINYCLEIHNVLFPKEQAGELGHNRCWQSDNSALDCSHCPTAT